MRLLKSSRHLVLAILAIMNAPLFAQDWPQFRGPSGDGCAIAKNLPTTWGGFDAPPAWQTNIPGNGWSSPIVIAGKVWLTSAEQTALSAAGREKKLAANPILTPDFQTHASVTLLAIEVDADSGKLLRQLELFTADDPKPIHAQNTYASPTSVSDGERLYCHFGSLGTCCVNMKSGEVLWKQVLSVDEITGPGGSPVLCQDLLIFACDGTDQQFVVALNKLTGKEVWRTRRPAIAAADNKLRRAFSTPLVITHAAQEQVVVAGAQWVCSYEPATGQEIWRVNFGDGHAVVPRPVFKEGLVYICTGFMKPQLWAIKVAGKGDVTESHVAWTYDKQVPEISSPLVSGNEVYFVSSLGIATCLDARSGEQLWQQRLGGNFAASPLQADDKLYFTSQEGLTFVLKPGRKYEELARNQLFGQMLASLAIYNDSLLIRTQSQLSCIRKMPSPAETKSTADRTSLQKAVSFYASFDEALVGDYGSGGKSLGTRFDSAGQKGAFDFEPGFDPRVFKIAKDRGIQGGALEVTGVLPRRGRIFFPAKGNIAYRAAGWGGAVSFWMNTNPNTSLQTPFCDPVQITEKGSGDGGLWCDFPDTKPREFRLGAFPAVLPGGQPIPESAADAPLVHMPKVGFQVGEWHHVVLNWDNFDSGQPNASAVLFVDGKRIGEVRDREIAMRWNLDKTGIYIALNYIGLLDEFAIFQRALTDDEVALLQRTPDLLTGLRTPAPSAGALITTSAADLAKIVARERQSAPPAAPAFPFNAEAAKKYQQEYAAWLGVPTLIRNQAGQELVLLPPGQFLMGSPAAEPGRADDELQHPVRLTQPFYLARHETTVAQFRAFVERTQYVTDGERSDGGHAHDELAVWQHRAGTTWRRPGYAAPLTLTEQHPVVQVSQADATEYCRWLSAQGVASTRYTLPTEAEWEWACRAGAATRFWWGADVDASGKVANVGDEELRLVHPQWPREIMPMNDGHAFLAPVGSYRANAFGLHDMLGNVWEFCSTRAGKYPAELTSDPGDPGDLAPDRGFAVRGGGWSNMPHDVRCATRNADPPHFCHSNLGFRVALRLNIPQ